MTLEEIVRTRLPKNTRIDFRLDNESIRLEQISDGILFIMAIWSGTCHASLRALSSALTTEDPNSTIPLFIVDTEDCHELITHPDFAGKLGGDGETAWYKSGKQIGFAKRGDDPSLYVTNTKKLLT